MTIITLGSGSISHINITSQMVNLVNVFFLNPDGLCIIFLVFSIKNDFPGFTPLVNSGDLVKSGREDLI